MLKVFNINLTIQFHKMLKICVIIIYRYKFMKHDIIAA